MFFFVNLLGLVVFLGIGVLASRNRKEIQWRSVASLLTLNLMLAWFLTSFEIGREKCVDLLLGILHPSLSLELILGVVLFPFAWLLGLAPTEAFQIAQYMGTKFITNEFVVMLQIQDVVRTWPAHMQAVMTVFITSFANLGTIGIILGCFKGLVDSERNTIVARNVSYMILSGLLVSLLSAAICGLFVW